jgi:Peptidase family M23
VRRLAVLLAVVEIAIPRAIHAAPPLPLKLLVLPSPRTPELFQGDGKRHIAYELLLANFSAETIRIDSLWFSGAAAPPPGEYNLSALLVNENIDAKALKSMFSLIGANTQTPQEAVLKSSEAGIIFLFEDEWNREKWTNTLTVEAVGKPETQQAISVDMSLSEQKPVIISAPLRGKNWWTPNGPTNDSTHRRVVIAAGDHLGLPERFAVDWIQLGPDGKSYSGAEADNRSYHAYNSDVLAAADGQVVSTKDGIPENIPQSPKMAVPITLDTIGGNFVMEDIGNGRYAFYAHLIPGSLTVKPGDRIKAGQVIGKLGNSGNSSEPHLHFHVCDAPTPLFCNGQPFEIDHFTRWDYKMERKGDVPVKFEIGGPHPETDETFMNEDLGEFSAQAN